MRDGDNACAMEIESGMEGLPLPEPDRVQKQKRTWNQDMELTWEEKAVLVLHICREQLRSYPKGCNLIPTSFFDQAECEARSSSTIPEQSTGGSNKTFDDSCGISEEELVNEGLCISQLDLPREADPEMPDEDKLEVLNMVRLHQVTEYDPKCGWDVCTCFSRFNLAFFDLDEESNVGLGPPFSKLTPNQLSSLESSVNVISLKVIESDLGYPINVYGTVLARDEVDYKCVYLFKRDKEDPQLINSSNDGLILTGPERGLAVSDAMFFEYNLKIWCDDDTGDRTLSKGSVEYNPTRYSKRTISTRLTSWLSTVELVLTHVRCALDATLTVTVLKGPPDFCGRITACSTGNKDDHIILFDNEASGIRKSTGEGGWVLSRVVSVTFDEQLVFCFSVGHETSVLYLGHPSKIGTCRISSYELRAVVSLTGNVSTRRKKVFGHLGHALVLL